MPLNKCPDCGHDVSTKAEACPHCGCPLTVTADLVGGRRVQTIEQTAKRYKLTMLIGGASFVVGCLLITPAWLGSASTDWTGLGYILAALGLPCYLHGRIAAWWHHG